MKSKINDDQIIARYISFEKFVDMMEFSRIFIPSMRTLQNAHGNQGDPLEGTGHPGGLLAKSHIGRILDIAMNAPGEKRGDGVTYVDADKYAHQIPDMIIETLFGNLEKSSFADTLPNMIRWVDIWCWNKFEHERIDMWRAYGGTPGSVMVRSTVGKIKSELHKNTDMCIAAVPVEYISRDAIPTDENKYSIFSQKSRAYKAEEEIRFILHNEKSDINKERNEPGATIKLNLRNFIDDVVAHYDTPPWLMESINAITMRALDKKPMESSIKIELDNLNTVRSMLSP